MHLWERVLREMAGEAAARVGVETVTAFRGSGKDPKGVKDPHRAAKLRGTKRPSDRVLVGLAKASGLDPVVYMRALLERAGMCEAGQEVPMEQVRSGNGQVLVPTRGTALKSSLSLAASALPEVVRENLAPKVPRYCEILLRDMESDPESKAHAEAMKLFPHLLGLIGGGQDAEEIVKKLLGVKNMVEALRKLQVADLAERVETDEDAEREALKFVNECRAARGQRPLMDPDAVDAEVIG